MRRLRAALLPEPLAPPRRQRVDKGLATGVEDFRPRAEIAEKRYKPRILAATIIGENFKHLARVREATALCRTQKHPCDPVREIAADD
jgi:hypothetical protein